MTRVTLFAFRRQYGQCFDVAVGARPSFSGQFRRRLQSQAAVHRQRGGCENVSRYRARRAQKEIPARRPYPETVRPSERRQADRYLRAETTDHDSHGTSRRQVWR